MFLLLQLSAATDRQNSTEVTWFQFPVLVLKNFHLLLLISLDALTGSLPSMREEARGKAMCRCLRQQPRWGCRPYQPWTWKTQPQQDRNCRRHPRQDSSALSLPPTHERSLKMIRLLQATKFQGDFVCNTDNRTIIYFASIIGTNVRVLGTIQSIIQM